MLDTPQSADSLWVIPFTRLPNEFIDSHLADLTGSEVKVYLYLCRRTIGFQRARDSASIDQICNGIRELDRGTGLAIETAIEALRRLEARGLITRTRGRGPKPDAYAVVEHAPLSSLCSENQSAERSENPNGKRSENPNHNIKKRKKLEIKSGGERFDRAIEFEEARQAASSPPLAKMAEPACSEGQHEDAGGKIDPEHPRNAQAVSDTRESANASGDISEEIARAAKGMRMPSLPAKASYDELARRFY